MENYSKFMKIQVNIDVSKIYSHQSTHHMFSEVVLHVQISNMFLQVLDGKWSDSFMYFKQRASFA